MPERGHVENLDHFDNPTLKGIQVETRRDQTSTHIATQDNRLQVRYSSTW